MRDKKYKLLQKVKGKVVEKRTIVTATNYSEHTESVITAEISQDKDERNSRVVWTFTVSCDFICLQIDG